MSSMPAATAGSGPTGCGRTRGRLASRRTGALAGGKKVYKYQITNIGSSLALGTFCHENGHMLCGFPDIYDYGYDSRRRRRRVLPDELRRPRRQPRADLRLPQARRRAGPRPPI